MELRNKLPLRLPRLGTGRPLRFLGRRLVQVMAGNAVYLDGRQLERVTPCAVRELGTGSYRVRLVLPGHVLHEGQLLVEDGGGRRQRYFVRLQPEPPMGYVEVLTFPARARLRVAGEE